jgi:hypothetical protein
MFLNICRFNLIFTFLLILSLFRRQSWIQDFLFAAANRSTIAITMDKFIAMVTVIVKAIATANVMDIAAVIATIETITLTTNIAIASQSHHRQSPSLLPMSLHASLPLPLNLRAIYVLMRPINQLANQPMS